MSSQARAGCTVAECERPVKARRWCRAHYDRWLRTGDTGPGAIRTRQPRDFICTVTGCSQPHHAVGLCNTHYMRQRATGTTASKPPTRRTRKRHAQAQIQELITTNQQEPTDTDTTRDTST